MMHPEVTEQGVRWLMDLPTGERAVFYYHEIRREKTGVHALVAIALSDGSGDTILAHDTFNIGRHADRTRVANAAHKQLGEVHKAAWELIVMQHDLDTTALATPKMWEEQRIEVVRYDAVQVPPPLTFALEPFIINGGGTIFFAPGGSGKSYLLQAIACSVASGNSTLWPVTACPVLYINIERDGGSMHRRERAIMSALGHASEESGVDYLHARGMSLKSVERTAMRWLRDHDGYGGVMLDSLSRGGLGSLNDDEVANTFTDILNGLQSTWWASIGHTSKGGGEKNVFGSVHFENGADVAVQVKSDQQSGTLGLGLTITKSNDIGKYPTQYLALEFDQPNEPVSRMRHARDGEFPDLLPQAVKELDTVREAILSLGGTATANEIVEATGLNRSNVSDKLNKGQQFVKLPKDGRSQPYGVVAVPEDDE